MNLTEYQAKKILRTIGLRVPVGRASTSVDDAVAHLDSIGTPPWVIKAQIRAGGRSNGHFLEDSQARGGVRFADTPDQVRSNVMQMLGGYLVTRQTRSSGEFVESVYIEERCEVDAEMYLALTLDRDTSSIVFMAAPQGGTEIENLAARDSEAVRRFTVDIETREIPSGIAEYLQLGIGAHGDLDQLLSSMLTLFIERDATLIELNPLGRDADGQLLALDATIVWDDNALFRQGHEEQLVAYDDLPESEYLAIQHGLNYVKLAGDIGVLAAGAGLAMATIDAIKECGGEPANFLDVPPSASVDRLAVALELPLNDPDITSILVNVFGGGIMRCDAVADALLLINKKKPVVKPVVVRLVGTNAQLALQRLQSSMPVCHISSDLASAASLVVQLTAKTPPRTPGDQPSAEKSWWKRAKNRLVENQS